MSEESSAPGVLNDVAEPLASPKTGLLDAHAALNRSRNCFAAFFLCYFVGAFAGPVWYWPMLIIMPASFVLAYVFLGVAAARARRSWVMHAVLPLVVPILGGLISFGILRSKVPFPDV